ncbi:MAG: deoxyribonuclease IV, partial [Atopobium sp.]|nr:deoxyribonuclease IV [Atopobium sp.]
MQPEELFIGCHLSAGKGWEAMGKDALSIGATTFAFFTRNPRGGNAKALDEADVAKLRELLEVNHFGPLVAHAPYTMNLCSAKEETRDFARRALTEDLERMEYLPDNYYNFHPGSHVGQGSDVAIEQISGALNDCLFEGQHTTVLLETMAGKGTEVGKTFEEIAAILDKVNHPELMGVCLDTCHVHDGGYEIVENLDEVLDTFDQIVGLEKLKALHLNDSKNPLGAHKDRHEQIGKGFIGLETFRAVVTNPRINT